MAATASAAAQTPPAARLNGTYVLNTAKSDRPADVIRSAGDLPQDRQKELETLIGTKGTVAIEVRGTQVTLADGGAPVALTADGRTRPGTGPGSRTKVRATLAGGSLTVSVLEDARDVTTTFSADPRTDGLKVTRRVTTEYLTETLFTDSFYDRTDRTARFEGAAPSGAEEPAYSSNDPTDTQARTGRPEAASRRPGTYHVANGEILTGRLENDIITGVTQDNDRFRFTVIAPAQYKGAVISGYVTGVSRSGKVSGRPELTLNFETIRLTDGRTFDFAGFLVSVTDSEGRTVKVDAEGAAKGDSQAKETAKRSGIGAGLGAVLGAIIGGGKGAVIGAVIGGGAGAGSVAADGKEDLKLLKGTSVTVRASAPGR